MYKKKSVFDCCQRIFEAKTGVKRMVERIEGVFKYLASFTVSEVSTSARIPAEGRSARMRSSIAIGNTALVAQVIQREPS